MDKNIPVVNKNNSGNKPTPTPSKSGNCVSHKFSAKGVTARGEMPLPPAKK